MCRFLLGLRESIRYRAYGQRDPLVEYKREAYGAFVDLMGDVRRSIANLVFRAQLETRPVLRAPRVSSLTGPSDSSYVVLAQKRLPSMPQTLISFSCKSGVRLFQDGQFIQSPLAPALKGPTK